MAAGVALVGQAALMELPTVVVAHREVREHGDPHAKADACEMRIVWWRRLKEGKIERATFKRYVAPLKERVWELLAQGAAYRQRKTVGTCRELLDLFPALWTFVSVEGIEPTNNAAERALCHAVI